MSNTEYLRKNDPGYLNNPDLQRSLIPSDDYADLMLESVGNMARRI